MEELTVKELTKQVSELEEQREKALKKEKYDEGAAELKNMHDSYIRAGFNEAQAWELVTIIVSNSTKKTNN